MSDEFTVPVCRVHHSELHRSGNDAAWWRKLNIDPLPVALQLWQQARTTGETNPFKQGFAQAQVAITTTASVVGRTERAMLNLLFSGGTIAKDTNGLAGR